MTELNGQRIAFLLTDGVEQVELTQPWQAVQDAGGTPVLVSPAPEAVQAFNQDVEKADTFPVDVALGDANEADYAALVLPGGTTNPDKLRTMADAIRFVTAFQESGKPVAAICHGPWSLVEAGLVRGKQLTSWPSLKTDIRNAGGDWQDAEVVVCRRNGWTLVTSRKPDDLPAFSGELLSAFAAAS